MQTVADAQHGHVEFEDDGRRLGTVLGMNRFDQGDYAGARELLRESLAMRRALLGDAPHPELMLGLNNLALAYYFDAEFGEAEGLYRDALDMARLALTVDVKWGSYDPDGMLPGDLDDPDAPQELRSLLASQEPGAAA